MNTRQNLFLSLLLGFRSLQGLPIMNRAYTLCGCDVTNSFCPLQGLPIMNHQTPKKGYFKKWFPSPTGVTYYESKQSKLYIVKEKYGFRPLQGLPIMNHLHLLVPTVSQSSMVSVPYRGYLLWIKNEDIMKNYVRMVSVPYRGYLLWIVIYNFDTIHFENCFRPLQGLPIMYDNT